MKQGLKRIEATLNQLHAQAATPLCPSLSGSQIVLRRQPNRSDPSSGRTANSPSFNLVKEPSSLQKRTSSSEMVQPFPVQESCPAVPTLPKYKLPTFSSHRHAANPALAMGILKEMESIVGAWQIELQHLLRQIQELYLEGPIVDGWLESDSREPRQRDRSERTAFSTTTLQPSEVDRMMKYVQEICASPSPNSRTGYRLCGLDADGQLWFRPCPADQVPQVSLAIARYHKLRQFLARKQDLESRLTQFAQDLVELHGKMSG
jgi:hypothetical protein